MRCRALEETAAGGGPPEFCSVSVPVVCPTVTDSVTSATGGATVRSARLRKSAVEQHNQPVESKV